MTSDFELDELEAARISPRRFSAGRALSASMDMRTAALNVIYGWLMIYASAPKREIVDFVVPGDVLGGFPIDPGSHRLIAATLTEALLCPIPWPNLQQIRRLHTTFDLRLQEIQAATVARSRDHVRWLGWRSAKERVASLLLELSHRSRPGVAIADGDTVFMPLTQQHIADASGLTAIHVNRTLKELREEGICELKRGALWIGLHDEMAALAGDWGEHVRSEA